jgi:hypothetical protein
MAPALPDWQADCQPNTILGVSIPGGMDWRVVDLDFIFISPKGEKKKLNPSLSAGSSWTVPLATKVQ